MLDLDKNKTYLLGCSFGPDSMALFDMLEKEGIPFAAALVNYHLREESDSEMRAFIDYCEEHHVPYHVKDLIKGVPTKNIEAECRNIRYKFFKELVHKFHYEAVLIAHNQDDLIETYLMQKTRKNLVIFYGIQEKTEINGVQVIRPLLSYKKQELADYCKKNNVPFVIDSSNLENRFLRNRIRHEKVSKMNDEERREVLDEIHEKNNELTNMFNRLEKEDLNSTETYKKFSFKELAYGLNMLIKRSRKSSFLSMKQTKELYKIILNGKGNVDVPVRGGFIFRKSYKVVSFLKPKTIKYSYQLNAPDTLDNQYFFLDFTRGGEDRNIHLSDYPITIRTFKTGDTYHIKDYDVKVRRLFIDWKMPTELRNRWPIIENKEGKIIYIPRYQKDFVPQKDTNFYVK